MHQHSGRSKGFLLLLSTLKFVATARLNPLLIIVGPTASGKSRLALDLAAEFNGEVVNCDSLQLYSGLDIGTAKTPIAEQGNIPHHLIDVLPPTAVFTAGDYAAVARPIIADIAARGRLPIVTGGTGFYLRALLDGLAEGPTRDNALRARLSARESLRPGSLHRLLMRLDPATSARIHPNDTNKLIRALEICLRARRPASQVFLQGRQPLQGFSTLKIGLDPPRAALHQRIDMRTRVMFEAGLLTEVENLLAQGVPADAKAFESIGYKETLAVLQGRLSLPEGIELTTIATRQYAKRQMTWFRRDPDISWIQAFGDTPAAFEQAASLVRCLLAEFTSVN